jgi:site-specific DNA-cytosine methylase
MKIKVLSLFDGISVAQQALKELGYDVEYYASEIDKYAIQITQKNHPKTTQIGSVVDFHPTPLWRDTTLLIGGSPCQDLSIAKKNRQGLDGARSGLFWEYVRILKEVVKHILSFMKKYHV